MNAEEKLKEIREKKKKLLLELEKKKRKPIGFLGKGKHKKPIYYKINKNDDNVVVIKEKVKTLPSFIGRGIAICQQCGNVVYGSIPKGAYISGCMNCLVKVGDDQ
jgi:hypothetical protein